MASISNITPIEPDADGNILLAHYTSAELQGIPRRVTGYFDCSRNFISSLIGAPEVVGKRFCCEFNKITSLQGFPKIVGEDINMHCNLLTSLQGLPEVVNGHVLCNFNKLTSLQYCPKLIKGDFFCVGNTLNTLNWFPEEVSGSFFCYRNPTLVRSELYKILDKVRGKIFYCSNGDTSLRPEPEDVYQLFYERDRYKALQHDEIGNIDL